MSAPPRPGVDGAEAGSAPQRLAPWVLGFLAYGITYAGAVRLSQPSATWELALRGAALTIWPEAAMAPVVLALVRRARWEHGRIRLLLLHLAGAVAFSALSLGGTVVSFAFEARVTRGAWGWPQSWDILIWRGVMTLVVYCALCGIGHAAALGQRVRDEAARAARAETLRAEARLAALRAQLEPHFILNVLHSLVGMVEREPRTAAAALERLGGLLRHALRVQRQDGEVVPLRDELQLLDDYLALERLRLGPRLRARVDADPRALEEPVPAFVLQPLVENAIRHAIAPRAQGGALSVSAEAVDGTVLLRVTDDGTAGGHPGTGGEGLGLRLIEERLAMLYGGAATLRTGASPEGGFVAEVAIPRRGHGREVDE